jgi:hypothetical protein
MKHLLEKQLILSLSEGHNMGDKYCTYLLEEYNEIFDDEEARFKFVELIHGKLSDDAYKSWMMVHKNIFYDDRKYIL